MDFDKKQREFLRLDFLVVGKMKLKVIEKKEQYVRYRIKMNLI